MFEPTDLKNSKLYSFRGTPFSVISTEAHNREGCWSSQNVSVYMSGDKIGEYLRKYPDFVESTFCPFQAEGEWYALYSADYTTTRVAKLGESGFEDWCGEDSSPGGFCPVEFYVPRFKVTQEEWKGKILTTEHFESEYDETELDEYYSNWLDKGIGFVGEKFCEYGFVSGCIWGDDSSWKLRYIDLSKVPGKELAVEEKFGYFELPDLPLRECIRNISTTSFSLTNQRCYSLTKGKFLT